MPAFTLKNRLGIDGTEAWIVSPDHFPQLLDLIYAHHHGEIWLFNNDLQMFADSERFREIYIDKIGDDLGSHIRSIKVLLNHNAAKYVFPKPQGFMRSCLRKWVNERAANPQMPELLFGKVSDAFLLPGVGNLLNRRIIPKNHAWIFYVHGSSLAKNRQNGLALLRPTEFPFSRHEGQLALSWHLSEQQILNPKYREAFTKSFLTHKLFRRVNDQLNWENAPEYDKNVKIKPEGIAFGEDADILVVAPAADELRGFRDHLHGIRKVPSPHGTEETYECWTKRGEKHVVLAPVGEGNIAAGISTMRLLSRFQPRHVILLGVAGAIPRGRVKFQIGDVVIAQTVIAYEWGFALQNKANKDSWEFRPKQDMNHKWGEEDPGRYLYHKADKYLDKPIQVKLPDSVKVPDRRAAKAALGIIGSGSKIIVSRTFIKNVVHKVDSKINAFETEAAGVCRACEAFGKSEGSHHVECLVIRGIMDMCDSATRSDRMRKRNRDYARETAATFTAALLESL